MKKQKEVGYTFNEHKQNCYDSLEDIATFYLEKTETFKESFDNIIIAINEVKKLNRKGWINSKK